MDKAQVQRAVQLAVAEATYRKSGKIFVPVASSARHIHLCRADVEKLFGAGLGQLYIREHDKASDREVFVKGTDIEVALKTCDLKTIGFTHRKNFLSIF